MVISSPWSRPDNAASTISPASITMSAGICDASIPERSQISVRVTPGKTAWIFTPVPSSSALND
ncbi:hypothetical protein D3C72_2516360 [compost metagenome]